MTPDVVVKIVASLLGGFVIGLLLTGQSGKVVDKIRETWRRHGPGAATPSRPAKGAKRDAPAPEQSTAPSRATRKANRKRKRR